MSYERWVDGLFTSYMVSLGRCALCGYHVDGDDFARDDASHALYQDGMPLTHEVCPPAEGWTSRAERSEAKAQHRIARLREIVDGSPHDDALRAALVEARWVVALAVVSAGT